MLVHFEGLRRPVASIPSLPLGLCIVSIARLDSDVPHYGDDETPFPSASAPDRLDLGTKVQTLPGCDGSCAKSSTAPELLLTLILE